jgi:hypothetical protein
MAKTQDKPTEPKVIQINQKTGRIITVPDGESYEETSDGPVKAIGVVVPRGTRTNLTYLKHAREYALEPDNDIHDVIRLSNVMYYREGLVGQVIDMFVDYAATEMEVEGVKPDSKEYDLCMHWMKNVNKDNNNMETGVDGLISEMMLEYWLAGNIFPFKVQSRVSSDDITSKKMRKSTFILPMDTYLIDPMFMRVPEAPTIMGSKKLYLKLDEDVIQLLKSDEEEAEAILEGLPPNLRNAALREGMIELPEEFITHIKRKSRGYQTWGIPYLTRTFGAYARKKKLQALDESTIDGLINQITVFKIGDPKDETRQTWDTRRLRAFAALLAQPHHTNYLVWTPDVDIITVGPSETILAIDKKYEQVDKELLVSMGMPLVLLSGEGDRAENAENVWVSVSSLLRKIETARNQCKKYVEEEMYEFLKENKKRGIDIKLSDSPTIRWRKPDLRNEKEFREFVLGLYDRGILPIETGVKEAGYDWKETKKRKVAELDEKIEGHTYEEVFFRRDLPFSAPGEGAPGAPDGKGRPTLTDPPKKPDNTNTEPTFGEDGMFAGFDDLVAEEVFSLYRHLKEDIEKSDLYVVGHFERIRTLIKAACDITGKEWDGHSDRLDEIGGSLSHSVEVLEQTTEDGVRQKMIGALCNKTAEQLKDLIEKIW